MSSEHEKEFQKMYKAFRLAITEALVKEGDSISLMHVVVSMMVMAKSFKIKKGEKKQAILQVLTTVIREELSGKNEEAAILIVETFIDPLIDAAASYQKLVGKCKLMCC